ncbi:MAG: hypothetical protein IAG13_13020 [Deltaproteobacteria bacterium]|nr:hypothetical protein [Nannocystaceae bacterium]
MSSVIARVWGIGGVLVLLAQALVRLTPRALEAIDGGLTTLQWALLAAWCAFMIHAEGIKGFHRRFSPRVVARAWALAERPRHWQLVLAPAYCMSLFHASRRGMIVAWSIMLGVFALILAVSQLGQPWRGIIDAGVVLALGWGVIALAYFTVRALGGHRMPVPPDVP